MALPPDGQEGLVAIPITDPRISRKIGLISRQGRQLPVAAQVLYDMLVAKKRLLELPSTSLQR